VLPCGGETSEVTAFGTYRCVSGQFGPALPYRKVHDSMSILNEAGHNIRNRGKTNSFCVDRVMHSEIARVLQKKKPVSSFGV
jgi:hypothetical protein